MTQTGDLPQPTRREPLYKMVRDDLRSQIDRGRYGDGDLIPPEQALCDLYGASRITVRRAVTELATEGLLEKIPGKGTFVRASVFSSPSLVSLAGFGKGEKFRVGPRRRVLRRWEEPADAHIASLLQVARGTPLFGLERLMSDGDRPLAIDTTHYVAETVPDFLTMITDDVSTFSVLTQHYGYELGNSSGEIRVGFATANQATLLACTTNDPLLMVEKVISTRGGAPLVLSEIAYNPRGMSLRFQWAPGDLSRGEPPSGDGLSVGHLVDESDH